MIVAIVGLDIIVVIEGWGMTVVIEGWGMIVVIAGWGMIVGIEGRGMMAVIEGWVMMTGIEGPNRSADEVGYIKGRRVSMLLRQSDDVTDQLNVRQKPGLLLMIDYCQAFDRISKDFMIHTLKIFGLGPDFVKWVSVLMADTKRCVAYCGWLSEYFAVEAGIRQGCPFFTISLCSCSRTACNKNTTL